ncbi:MAG: RimK/LysX family protein [Gammaproteobacteria bacterium]|nr:RimK/LysX family protein [Gammaproteobacteria bacterium]MDH3560084.1 RimK/LysX family protein [Gammaproteobacteria bacterium]
MKHFILMLLLIISVPGVGHAKQVVGWTENAVIYPGGLELRAKIDTGAMASSLNCECRNLFEKDGEQWVRFSVINYQGEQMWLERKIHRMANIKRHFGGIQERPVIILGVCLGNVYRETEVNVIDRSGLDYQMLIGRKFLEGEFLVDSSAQFINPPQCDVRINE